jgi:hypothetical protein
VKKVAFLRQANPIGFGFAIRAVNKLKRTFFAPPICRLCCQDYQGRSP